MRYLEEHQICELLYKINCRYVISQSIIVMPYRRQGPSAFGSYGRQARSFSGCRRAVSSGGVWLLDTFPLRCDIGAGARHPDRFAVSLIIIADL